MIIDKPVIIEPDSQVRKAIFWMHGLGADGYDFVPVINELGLGSNHGIRFIFPQAPVAPVTINGGMEMRSWYDITSISNIKAGLDTVGIDKSSQSILTLMHQQHEYGIAWKNMAVAGFSQGGVIAIALAMNCPGQIAGLMCLSTYFPFDIYQKVSGNIPAFVGHGKMDKVIPYSLGQECQHLLAEAGFSVQFHSYDMDHGLCQEEVKHISQWLQKLLC